MTTHRLPLLPLRVGALFPHVVLTVPVGRDKSTALVATLARGDLVLVARQRSSEELDPGRADLHDVATLARVHRVVRTTDGSFRLVLEGLGRATLGVVERTEPFWLATAESLPDRLDDPGLVAALASALRERLPELAPFVSGGLPGLLEWSAQAPPAALADRIASTLPLSGDEQTALLEAPDVADRLRLVTHALDGALAKGELRQKIDAEVRRGLGESQKKALLREQLRAITAELGEDAGELSALRAKFAALGPLPSEVQESVDRELARLDGLSPQQAEAGVARTWLELVASLPWNARADERLDVDAVERALDADHDGLLEPKKRILEHLAVRKLGGAAKATILCLVGPPGVGKTSLGQSVADALGRPFVRIALGGVRDEAEIRGHRRTYVGALPGRILTGLKRAGVRNPVVLLDEIDKLGQGFLGSPEAALLEVLDPEQNHTFTDHYLELPFDLSEVLFLTTANDLSTVSGPLRDRLEIIEIEGYTLDEKLGIARRHLLGKELADLGITEDLLPLSDATLTAVVRGWTREAGVRQLRRELRKLVRALALSMARTPDVAPRPLAPTPEELPDLLGRRRFFDEAAERTSVPGVATGLAWTPVGGDILFIETSRMPGKGAVRITGQLGDVMQESVHAALTYLRVHADELGLDPRFLDTSDLHVHVPAGGVPKDGPSAGVTMFTALTSLMTGRRVRPDVAMTGEVTLRGRVLPVGGIKSKVLAAHRAGLRRVILPRRNEADAAELPASVREALEIVFVDEVSEVLAAALEPVVVSASASPGLGPVHAA